MSLFQTLLVLTILFSIVTLLPLWRHETWWVRSLDFPRIQFFLLTVIILLLDLVMLDLSQPATWSLIVTILLCIIFQAWWIIPYTRLFPVEVKTSKHSDIHNTVGIMTANVLTTNRNADGFIELVSENKPDVIVTLETDEWWQSKLDILEGEYCYTIKCPLDNLYGMHVYSKLPLSDSHIEFMIEPDVPSIHTLIHLPSGHKIRTHFLHPAPPSPTENESSSERDAELIIVAKSVAKSDLPVIVTGDLNDVAWSETTRLFRKISGLLDPRIGRGMYNTFHADYWFMRWPLDHLFHSESFTLSSMKRLPPFGSDHFALFTKLIYEVGSDIKQDGLNADKDDRSWATSKLENVDVDKSTVPAPGESK